jgi:hypothetical protein
VLVLALHTHAQGQIVRALMKKTKSKVPFNTKKRKVLAQDLEKINYSDVIEAAIDHLQSGVHLELSKPRSRFV